jgi:hypothetical protein
MEYGPNQEQESGSHLSSQDVLVKCLLKCRTGLVNNILFFLKCKERIFSVEKIKMGQQQKSEHL